MEQHALNLLQASVSPLRPVVARALELAQCQAIPWAGPAAGAPVSWPAGLSLWDLEGFGWPEIQHLAGGLDPERTGVVGICLRDPGPALEVLLEAGALGLVVAPSSPDAVAAALRLAQGTWRRRRETTQALARLRRQWQDRRLVDQAKWSLVYSQGLGEDQALERLRRIARDHNLRLVEVARLVLNNPDGRRRD